MPLILTTPILDWVTVSNSDDMSTKAFRASDIRYLEMIRNETGLWTLIVYVHPADVRIQYMDADEDVIHRIFAQLMGLAHRADRDVPCEPTK